MSSAANPYLSKYCYRVYHRDNLAHILQYGLCTKHHQDADPHFRSIGNLSIINTRDTEPVRIEDYGTIGEYVPFYFAARSIMVYNIITGYYAPVVPKVPKEELIFFRSTVQELSTAGQFFFTNGQANDAFTRHTTKLESLSKIDWTSIGAGNFSKSDGDFDRPRRYQAEFLVYQHLPLKHIESILVYNNSAATFVKKHLADSGVLLPVHIIPDCFF